MRKANTPIDKSLDVGRGDVALMKVSECLHANRLFLANWQADRCRQKLEHLNAGRQVH